MIGTSLTKNKIIWSVTNSILVSQYGNIFFYNICTCEPRNEVYFVYKALSHRYGTLGKTTYSRLQKYFRARSTSFNILWSCTQRCNVCKYLLGKKENYLFNTNLHRFQVLKDYFNFHFVPDPSMNEKSL